MRKLHGTSAGKTLRPLTALAVSGLATALVLAATPAASATKGNGGPDPGHLADAGWFCFDHGGATHCTTDFEQVAAGTARTSTTLSFDAETGDYWGTELLIHEDLYHSQPCPQDRSDSGTADYVHLSALGFPLPYYVCHHFESPIT